MSASSKTLKDSITTTVIYDLVEYYLEEDAEKYPAAIYQKELGKYSSLDKVEAAIQSCVITGDPINDPSEDNEYINIHSFAVAEIELDVDPKEWGMRNVRIYDSKGIIYGTDASFSDAPFAGREAAGCRFQPGDFVEFISDPNKLEVGIVIYLPVSPDKVHEINLRHKKMYAENIGIKTEKGDLIQLVCDQSDDSYLIEYGTDNFTHEHLPECRLFTPKYTIDDATKKQLLERLRFCHGTYKVYIGWDHGQEKSKALFHVQLNDYVLDTILEPHIVILGIWRHLLISLLNFKPIKGDLDEFLAIEVQQQHYKNGQGSLCKQGDSIDKTDDFNRTLLFIKENQSLMISEFNSMLGQYAKKTDEHGNK